MSEIELIANKTVNFAKKLFGEDFIPLHRPIFNGNEKQYLIECIDSNFVSSVGLKVEEFEKVVAKFVGTKFAVAMVNGTAALHIAIKVAGVNPGDEVITQALTFIATCNAINYSGAEPIFIDVDLDTLGMSPKALEIFLSKNAIKRNGKVFNKLTGKKIAACVPMHTFGLPCRINEIISICTDWGIIVIEDAAESLGSYVDKKHTGTFGEMATLSFNGNKVITTGGGGMLVTNNESLAKRAKHISTTAKVSHPYEFFHDEIGFNYRMPNLNAALGCAQMEKLNEFLDIKADISEQWDDFFKHENIPFLKPLDGNKSNYWLNAIILDNRKERDEFLELTNTNGVMTRPIWELMSNISMFKDCKADELENSLWLRDRIVNIPSSVPEEYLKTMPSK